MGCRPSSVTGHPSSVCLRFKVDDANAVGLLMVERGSGTEYRSWRIVMEDWLPEAGIQPGRHLEQGEPDGAQSEYVVRRGVGDRRQRPEHSIFEPCAAHAVGGVGGKHPGQLGAEPAVVCQPSGATATGKLACRSRPRDTGRRV